MSKAQVFGAEVGYTRSKLELIEAFSLVPVFTDYRFVSGFHLAGTLEFARTGNFSLTTSLGATTKGFKYAYSSNPVLDGVQYTNNYSFYSHILYLEIPLQLKFRVAFGDFSLHACGGMYSAVSVLAWENQKTVLSHSENGSTVEEINSAKHKVEINQPGSWKRYDAGLTGTAGCQWKTYSINLTYQYGLMNVWKDGYFEEVLKNRSFIFTLGWQFGN